LSASLEKEVAQESKGIPIFMAHGQFDDLIPIDRARKSRDFLLSLGYGVEWHEYPMPHSVCAPEIDHLSQFLVRIL
jgi:phospholipase/carboxylesterase